MGLFGISVDEKTKMMMMYLNKVFDINSATAKARTFFLYFFGFLDLFHLLFYDRLLAFDLMPRWLKVDLLCGCVLCFVNFIKE